MILEITKKNFYSPIERSVREIRFIDSSIPKIEKGVIPDFIKSVTFYTRYEYPFLPGVFPPSVEEIKLPFFYSIPIPYGVFPKKLKSLYLNYNYVGSPNLPEGLEVLDYFNGEITLPRKIKKVIFLGKKVLSSFPSSIEEIALRTESISERNSRFLPPTLKKLTLLGFNHGDLVFPIGIEELNLGYAYPISNIGWVLPPKIRVLKCTEMCFLMFSKNNIPLTLEHLELRSARRLSPLEVPIKINLEKTAIKNLKLILKNTQDLDITFPKFLRNLEIDDDERKNIKDCILYEKYKNSVGYAINKINTLHPIKKYSVFVMRRIILERLLRRSS